MGLLGGVAFTTPWLLLGFLALPVLWWLMRVTPPAPRRQIFPALRLLIGLQPAEETPARTPLWLILLRLVLAGLIILALARPVVNPGARLPGAGPLLLVVDNGWAAAQDWPARQMLMGDLIDRAEREGQQILLLPTAPSVPVPGPLSLLRPAEARGAIGKLAPLPWSTDRRAAAGLLSAVVTHGAASVYWLSDGLDESGTATLARTLQALGQVQLVLPPVLPMLLKPLAPGAGTELGASVIRAVAGIGSKITLRALGNDGRLLGVAEGEFTGDQGTAAVAFNLPAELRNRVDQIELAGQGTAGARLLLDESARRRPVGIGSDHPAGSSQPLLSESFYLDRALAPFTELRHGRAADLIQRDLSLLILPDQDATALRPALEAWMQSGGVLLRFAGPDLAAAAGDTLLPVTLRRGGRTIGGALSWEQPAHLAAFPPQSPFFGLTLPQDVTVDRQVLAEPTPDLGEKSWARLSDGTPLVTAERRGKGWLILVHTTANTAWSNLPISGLFVDMLRRLVQLGQVGGGLGNDALAAWENLDGFGQLGTAPPAVRPIPAGGFATTVIGPEHPPGYYGTESSHRALNLGPGVPALAPLGDLPGIAARLPYAAQHAVELAPPLLMAALVLALLDLVIGYGLRGFLPVWSRRRALPLLLIGMLSILAVPARADPAGPGDAGVINALQVLRLGYIRSGDAETDTVSRDGLIGLGAVLNRRTAVELGAPQALDVETDELIFYPLIYWPVPAQPVPLSAEAAQRVNRYLATGGTILFDTRDQGVAIPGSLGAELMAQRLQRLLQGVQIPPLTQIPPDHVLTKSFYLMQDFPGRWAGGPVWVQPAADRVNDGVSTVILGSNDWASAWAIDGDGQPEFPVIPGGEPQREQALRFGVNVVMYALTGNYKADQVHVPTILERIGQ